MIVAKYKRKSRKKSYLGTRLLLTAWNKKNKLLPRQHCLRSNFLKQNREKVAYTQRICKQDTYDKNKVKRKKIERQKELARSGWLHCSSILRKTHGQASKNAANKYKHQHNILEASLAVDNIIVPELIPLLSADFARTYYSTYKKKTRVPGIMIRCRHFRLQSKLLYGGSLRYTYQYGPVYISKWKLTMATKPSHRFKELPADYYTNNYWMLLAESKKNYKDVFITTLFRNKVIFGDYPNKAEQRYDPALLEGVLRKSLFFSAEQLALRMDDGLVYYDTHFKRGLNREIGRFYRFKFRHSEIQYLKGQVKRNSVLRKEVYENVCRQIIAKFINRKGLKQRTISKLITLHSLNAVKPTQCIKVLRFVRLKKQRCKQALRPCCRKKTAVSISLRWSCQKISKKLRQRRRYWRIKQVVRKLKYINAWLKSQTFDVVKRGMFLTYVKYKVTAARKTRYKLIKKRKLKRKVWKLWKVKQVKIGKNSARYLHKLVKKGARYARYTAEWDAILEARTRDPVAPIRIADDRYWLPSNLADYDDEDTSLENSAQRPFSSRVAKKAKTIAAIARASIGKATRKSKMQYPFFRIAREVAFSNEADWEYYWRVSHTDQWWAGQPDFSDWICAYQHRINIDKYFLVLDKKKDGVVRVRRNRRLSPYAAHLFLCQYAFRRREKQDVCRLESTKVKLWASQLGRGRKQFTKTVKKWNTRKKVSFSYKTHWRNTRYLKAKI